MGKRWKGGAVGKVAGKQGEGGGTGKASAGKQKGLAIKRQARALAG